MNLLDLDARWRRLHDETRACPCCGKTFGGLMDVGYNHPDDWPHAAFDGQEVVAGEDRLNADLCRLSGRYFLRCVLFLPIRGSDDAFGFGPWAEVSEDVFRAYLGTYDDPPGMFDAAEGLLANTLPLFEDQQGAVVSVRLPDPTQRPQLGAGEGALAEAQGAGISFDQLLDIYDAAGLDVRAHLTRD